MAYFRTDGTADIEQKKFYRDNGTADVQIGKIYRGNGTVDSLLYSSELVIYNNGSMLRNWDSSFNSNYNYITKKSTYVLFQAYHWGCTVVGWNEDVTGYDTLTITLLDPGESTWGFVTFGITKSSLGYGMSWTKSRRISNGVAGTYTLDISEYSGKFNICVYTGVDVDKKYQDAKLAMVRLT